MLSDAYRHSPVILTDDGGELSYLTILHGLRAANVAARANVPWVAEDLARAIWAGLTAGRLPAHTSIGQAVECIRLTLDSIGYAELAPHFCIAAPVQHLSLADCVLEPPFKDEADLQDRVRASIRRSLLPGVRTLYVTDLPECLHAFETSEYLIPGLGTIRLRSRIVAWVRQELLLLSWRHPLQCHLS